MIKPSLYEYLKRIVEIHRAEGRGATYRDFIQYVSKSRIRTVFSKLRRMGLIQKVEGSWPAQYVPNYDALRREGLLAGEDGQSTDDPGWAALEAILERLGDEPFTIHDINLIFHSQSLRAVLDANPTRFKLAGWKYNRGNKQWQSPRRRWHGRRRWIFARISKTGTVQVIVQCSDDPIQVDLESLNELMDALSDFRSWLVAQCQSLGAVVQAESLSAIPPTPSWRVVQWHFGKDALGIPEVSKLPAHNLTLADWKHGYIRLYVKAAEKGHVRLERVEGPAEPEKTLTQWLGERVCLAEALKSAARLAEESHKMAEMIKETDELLNRFAVQLQTHLEVLSAMKKALKGIEDTMKRQARILERIEQAVGGAGRGGGG